MANANSNLARRQEVRRVENAGEETSLGSREEFAKSLETEQPEPIPEIDETAVERTKNMLERARLVEKLEKGGELSEGDRERLGAMIKDRGWFGLFKELQAGDKMAYFSTPGGTFSVKNLNSLFGEQLTDSIIDSRKKALLELMAGAGHEMLTQDYRSASFKLSEAGSSADLNRVSERLNEQMVEVISRAIDRRIAEGMDGQKFNRLRHLLQEQGFRVNFGISEIGETASEKDKSNIVQSLAECAEMAQLSRHLSGDNYGQEFDREAVLQEISSDGRKEKRGINELGASLESQTVVDQAGIVYKVFEMENGRRVMNRDLLRLTRKGDLMPDKNSEDIFAEVQQYVRRINILDLVKPYTAGEVSGGVVARNVETMSGFVEKDDKGKYALREDLSQLERIRLSRELRKDQKDRTYDAPEFFHQEAMQLGDCVYINIDVLDLGVDLLLEYEQLIQEVGEDENKLREAALKAGDKITESMRDIRARTLKVFEEYFPGVKPIDRVGGDEVALAIEDPGDVRKMEKFLLALQSETGTRVIKTVVGGSERHSNGNDGDGAGDHSVREHLTALKRAERGSEMCKKIEKKMRLAELVLQQVKGISTDDETRLNEELARMEINQFKNIAVVEGDTGDLKVVCWRGGGKETEEKSLEDVIDWIGQKIAAVASGRG